jgi:hypothetical protein
VLTTGLLGIINIVTGSFETRKAVLVWRGSRGKDTLFPVGDRRAEAAKQYLDTLFHVDLAISVYRLSDPLEVREFQALVKCQDLSGPSARSGHTQPIGGFRASSKASSVQLLKSQ